MSDWAKLEPPSVTVLTPHVPDDRARVICQQYQSEHDQRRQGAIYYVNVYPWASWEDLATALYQCEEHTAIQVFKALLPKPKCNQGVECVGAVCNEAFCGTRTIGANFPLPFISVAPSALVRPHK